MKNLFCEKKNLNDEDSVEKLFLDRLIKKLNFKDAGVKTKESMKKSTNEFIE